MKVTLLTDPNRSPFLIVDVEPFNYDKDSDNTVLLYGHLDK